jgi:hypothetical protein
VQAQDGPAVLLQDLGITSRLGCDQFTEREGALRNR